LRQEPTVVLCDHIRGVLKGIARLLVGSGALENVGCQDIPYVMWPMRKKTFNGPALALVEHGQIIPERSIVAKG